MEPVPGVIEVGRSPVGWQGCGYTRHHYWVLAPLFKVQRGGMMDVSLCGKPPYRRHSAGGLVLGCIKVPLPLPKVLGGAGIAMVEGLGPDEPRSLPQLPLPHWITCGRGRRRGESLSAPSTASFTAPL